MCYNEAQDGGRCIKEEQKRKWEDRAEIDSYVLPGSVDAEDYVEQQIERSQADKNRIEAFKHKKSPITRHSTAKVKMHMEAFTRWIKHYPNATETEKRAFHSGFNMGWKELYRRVKLWEASQEEKQCQNKQ